MLRNCITPVLYMQNAYLYYFCIILCYICVYLPVFCLVDQLCYQLDMYPDLVGECVSTRLCQFTPPQLTTDKCGVEFTSKPYLHIQYQCIPGTLYYPIAGLCALD